MNWLAPRRRRTIAQRELTSLAASIGMETRSQWAPGLLAEVDQHAAAVRDILVVTGHGLGPVELADYARGVEDVARERGWRHGDDDWVSLRLAGVCLLAMADGAMASIADGDAALS
ncbi:DUF6401 family natural product biosynthesis protein [Jiangella anatolica]|uniref:Uncharacterized protein n=1 Tax=Jiangella anatolica TaxID=2670374 RepID=A0A2W2BWJ1_9ACTN|nr:DUF6401 family natural product biosynthesis protein [Jiangella anatolica]PZF80489.1 hypothetical protein C1I92_25820 [Jiangella anatolica]